jgi:hypothetical protein
MVRDDDEDDFESLEVIDLEDEVETPKMTSHPRRTFSRSSLTAGAVAIVGVVVVLVTIALLTHDGRPHATAQQSETSTSQTRTTGNASLPSNATRPPTLTTVPIQRPHGRILGRYYPVLDHTNTATLVLPSGRTLTVSAGLTGLIGGLGATFGGSVTNPTCCPNQVNFEIFHAAPSDLFETPIAGVVSTPLLMAPAQAKVGEDGLKGAEYRFGVLSTGDWTMIVFFLNYYDIVDTGLLHGWHLRSTPNGAVMSLPTDSTISTEYVTLGRTPDLTDREIMLGEHGCPAGSTKAQTLGEYATHAGWCEHGLLVQIFGPESYVGLAVADLKVTVGPSG